MMNPDRAESECLQGFGLKDLPSRKEEIRSKKLIVGYDGFIDTTVRPIKRTATDTAPAQMFDDIAEFGSFLTSKAGMSCSVELEVESRHPGGNMPYLLTCAGTLGLDVTGIGMMGDGGHVDELFSGLPGKLYSFAPSADSTCMEFRDGKVLLAPSYTLNDDGWKLVMEATKNQAPAWIRESDLLALVNWSELSFSHRLWENTYEHTLAEAVADKDKYVFFDLCDIARKTDDEIRGVLELIARFSTKRTTILSANENEILLLGRAVTLKTKSLEEIGRELRKQYKMDEILIHTRMESLLITNQGVCRKSSIFVEHPVMSTGAGDHFNAASCLAAVMRLDEEQRLEFANQVTSLYIRTGKTPSLEQAVKNQP